METILECSVCLSLICEPVTISCGHSFCRVCLVKSLRRSKKKCPSCRAVCHISAEDANENIMIKEMGKFLNPTLYAQREIEAEQEKLNWRTVLPVFYYNVAMFPGETLSLHLFEPRYKIMMRRVVDTTRSFAYVPNFVSYCAQPGDLAIVAELKEVEFLADGRCLIEATLRGRHRIVDHYVEEGTQGLHFCRLEPFQDDSVVEAEKVAELASLVNRSLALAEVILKGEVRTRVYRIYGPPPAVTLNGSSSSSAEAYSLWLTAVSPLDGASKTNLLLSTDTLARMQMCMQSLEVVMGRIAGAIGAGAGAAEAESRGSLRRLVRRRRERAAGAGSSSEDPSGSGGDVRGTPEDPDSFGADADAGVQERDAPDYGDGGDDDDEGDES